MTTASTTHTSSDASTSDSVVLLPLSPMDAVMSCFGFSILYIFPPPGTSSASSNSSSSEDSAANTNINNNHASFDLERLHTSFQALVEDEYRVLLGELHVHPTTGVVSVQQTPETTQRGAARLIPFTKINSNSNDTVGNVTTADAMQSLSMAFMPPRTPTQLVAIQATLLRDGGLVIGVNMSHTLLDGEGMFTFMKVWGEFYNDVAPAARTNVCHDRSVLAARGRDAQLPHPEFKLRAPLAEASTATAPAAQPAAAALPTTTQHVFHISPAMMTMLKAIGMDRTAAGNSTDGTTATSDYVSTIDVLTALLLVLIAQARGHNKSVRFTTGVNARKRFSPPLPTNYAGNVIFNALSTYDASELATLTTDALRTVARRVRASIQRRDDAFLRDAIEFVASQANLSDVLVGTDFVFGPDVMLTSWANFGMYDATFGGTTPWFVGPPRIPVFDGFVIVMEAMRGATGLDVVVFLETNAMAQLLALWEQVPFWK